MVHWAVTIHTATKLAGDKKTDAYVQVFCGEHKDETPHKKNSGTDTVFEQTLHVNYLEGEELRFTVKDHAPWILKDSILGTGAIHDAELRDGKFSGEIPLTTKKGQDGGRLRVTVEKMSG